MPALLHRALERSAARHPGKTALIMGESRTSYAELNAESNRLAHGLLEAGLRKGDRVAFLGGNSRALLATHYGAAKIGAVFTPLNSAAPVPELRLLMADAQPQGLVVGETHLEQAAELRDHLRELALCLACGTRELDGALPYEGHLARQSDSNPRLAIKSEDDFLMSHTGGTTGRPKAAVSTHAARVAMALDSAREYQVDRDDVGLHASPFFHYGTLHLGIHTKLMMGCTIVCHERFDAERYLEAIERHRVTYLSGVPTLLSRALAHPDASRYDFRYVRKILYGASSMPDAVQERALELWPRAAFYQGYGSTEAGQVTVLRPVDHAGARRRCTGVAMRGVEIKTVDEDGCEVPCGAVGELVVRSRQLFRCYHRQPELSARVLAHGWYHTRDAARIDDDGYLTVVGRIDDMIVTGGENVYPREVEDILLAHLAVADAVVFGVPDAEWVNAVCAAIVLRRGEVASPPALIDHCRRYLASYKKPRHFMCVPEISRTDVGKPDRKALAALFAERRVCPASNTPAQEPGGRIRERGARA